MRVHFLNSISTCPLGGALMDGFSYAKLRGAFDLYLCAD